MEQALKLLLWNWVDAFKEESKGLERQIWKLKLGNRKVDAQKGGLKAWSRGFAIDRPVQLLDRTQCVKIVRQ